MNARDHSPLQTVSRDRLREVNGGEEPARDGSWVELHDLEGSPQLFLPQTNWIVGKPIPGERGKGRDLVVQTQSGNYYTAESYATVRNRLLGKK